MHYYYSAGIGNQFVSPRLNKMYVELIATWSPVFFNRTGAHLIYKITRSYLDQTQYYVIKRSDRVVYQLKVYHLKSSMMWQCEACKTMPLYNSAASTVLEFDVTSWVAIVVILSLIWGSCFACLSGTSSWVCNFILVFHLAVYMSFRHHFTVSLTPCCRA
jgi:hypothetical protein